MAMPDYLPIILIVVFSIHLVVFYSLYHRRRQRHHLIFVLLFLLLVLSNVLRLWSPQLSLFGYTVHAYLRVAAWVTTVVAVFFWVKQKKIQK